MIRAVRSCAPIPALAATSPSALSGAANPDCWRASVWHTPGSRSRSLEKNRGGRRHVVRIPIPALRRHCEPLLLVLVRTAIVDALLRRTARDPRVPARRDGAAQRRAARSLLEHGAVRVVERSAAMWSVEYIDATGARSTIVANAVICAVGQLNRPSIPELPGAANFAGPAFQRALGRFGRPRRQERCARRRRRVAFRSRQQ